jgi:hypothetical protein
MDFGATVAGEKNRTAGCGDHIGAATLAETAANINAQAAVIGESRERVFHHPWCSATWHAGERDARIRSSDG